MADTKAADAVIVAAEIAAGHDGAAELIVALRYGNGEVSTVALDTDAGLTLMRNCGVGQLSDLAGHSWRGILEVLPCSI